MQQLHIQTIADHVLGHLVRGKFDAIEREAIMMIISYANENHEIYVYAYEIDVAFHNLLSADVYNETTFSGRKNAALIRKDAYADIRATLERVRTHDERKKQNQERLERNKCDATFTRGKHVVRMTKGFGITNLNFRNR